MEHSILHSRRASRVPVFLSLVLASLVLAATPGPGSDARAVVTYSYSGSHQLVWTSNTSKTLTVSRTGGYTALMVTAYLSGSSKFSISPSSVSWPDSSQDTGYNFPRYFSVSFSSNVLDTSIAWLLLTDGNRSDTIVLTGIGTPNTTDFSVADTSRSITVSDSGNIPAIVIDGIYNLQSSAINVTATLSDSGYWDLDGHGNYEVISVPGFSKTQFRLTYTPHGVYQDHVIVILTCTSPYYEQKTVLVQVTDPRYAPVYYAPTVTAPDLGLVQPGDSACGTVTIANHTVQGITITYISSDSIHWSERGGTLPFTIPAGGSMTVGVCYHPPQGDFGTYATDRIYVSYRDSSGLTGSVAANATAHTPSCMESLVDSLQLDDVIAGGYVEATAQFLVHRTFMLTAGNGYLSWGGTVQVVSPSLPMQVHAGDTVSLRFRVTPSFDTGSYSYYWGYIPLADSGCSAQISFNGLATRSTTSNLQLFPAQSELLAMTTSSQVTVDTFWFINNYPGEVHIPSGGVHLAQGTYFSILGEIPHSLPDTLTTSQSLGVIVQFSGDTNGFYHDSLYIDAEHALQSMPINLEAIRTGVPAAVRGVAASGPALLWLAPNPATGPVAIAIANAEKASIEIFDLLGNRVAAVPNALSSSWDATGMSGGIYIVRATGVDQNGNTFTLSKRLILAK